MASMRSLAFLALVSRCQAQLVSPERFYTSTYASEFYQSPGGTTTCKTNYMPITDVQACREVAVKIGAQFAETFRYSSVYPFPLFCTIKNGEVHFMLNADDIPHDTAISVLCIADSIGCENPDGSAPVTYSPCLCGTDTCYAGEYCIKDKNQCEVAPGYAESQKFGKDCPTGYQEILDAQACKEVAGLITTKRWGAVYSDWTFPMGCSSFRHSIVNYYVNDFTTYNANAYNYAVDVAKICIKKTMECDDAGMGGKSSSYPCTCGTDTCADGDICENSTSMCELIPGLYQTERKVHACPMDYRKLTQEECYHMARYNLTSKTMLEFPTYSGVARGCGTWSFHHINSFEYPGLDPGYPGRAWTDDERNPENALLCWKTSMGALPKTLEVDQWAEDTV